MTPVDAVTLDVVLDAVSSRVSYLKCAHPPEGDDWYRAASLIDDPQLLTSLVDSTAAGRGTDDRQVAASLFSQAYAYRVSSIAVAAFVLGLPGPTLDPASVSVRIVRSLPGALAVSDAELVDRDSATLASDLIGGHLVPFAEALRSTTTVGARLLAGNAVASIAAVCRTVDATNPAGDPMVRARSSDLFAALDDEINAAGLGSWSVLDVEDRSGWYWDRTSCCLWWRTTSDPVQYCADCSLLEPRARDAGRLEDLTGRTGT